MEERWTCYGRQGKFLVGGCDISQAVTFDLAIGIESRRYPPWLRQYSYRQSDEAGSEEDGALYVPAPPGRHGLYRRVVRSVDRTATRTGQCRVLKASVMVLWREFACGVCLVDFCVFC